VADLRVLVALDITPPLVQTDNPPAAFEDTLCGRLGVEYRRPTGRTDWALRAGYAYLPSPVPEQVGLTSFADNDRHTLALGAGATLIDWRPLLTRPIELALAFQWHHLVRRLTVKDATQFPGEAFSSAGDIFHLGTSATVHF
jgi:long-subunit fatty acid transport protein